MTATAATIGLTPEQVAARRTYIGGSDAAAVLGVSPYRTPLDIYQIKVGEREPDPPNAAMRRGIFLEPIARKLYRELTGRKVRRLGLVRHPERAFMGCLVDGVIGAAKKNGHDGPGVLEIKAPGMWTFAKIEREGLPMDWLIQMNHNLEVTGLAWGSFAIFSAELWRMIHLDVLPDLELQHALVIKEQQFWLQFVEKRVPPPEQPDTTPELMAQLAKAQDAIGGGELIVRNDPEWAEAARVYLEAKEILETGEYLKATAVERLKQVMGAKGAVEGAGVRTYWSERKGRVTFDRKALAAAKPLDRAKVFASVSETELPEDVALKLLNRLGDDLLDLEIFNKVGKPYDDFRTYVVKAGIGD